MWSRSHGHGGELHPVGLLVHAHPEPEVGAGRPRARARRATRLGATSSSRGVPPGARSYWPSTLLAMNASSAPASPPVTLPPTATAVAPGAGAASLGELASKTGSSMAAIESALSGDPGGPVDDQRRPGRRPAACSRAVSATGCWARAARRRGSRPRRSAASARASPAGPAGTSGRRWSWRTPSRRQRGHARSSASPSSPHGRSAAAAGGECGHEAVQRGPGAQRSHTAGKPSASSDVRQQPPVGVDRRCRPARSAPVSVPVLARGTPATARRAPRRVNRSVRRAGQPGDRQAGHGAAQRGRPRRWRPARARRRQHARRWPCPGLSPHVSLMVTPASRHAVGRRPSRDDRASAPCRRRRAARPRRPPAGRGPRSARCRCRRARARGRRRQVADSTPPSTGPRPPAPRVDQVRCGQPGRDHPAA